MPVGICVSVDELLKGGLDEEASREIIGRVAIERGLAFVNASVSAYAWPSIGYHVADISYPPHLFMEQTAALRSVTGDLPLLTANRYASLGDAEEGLTTGVIDMVGMNRAHMADPNIVQKTMAGEEETIRPCISSNFCIGQIAFHRPITWMMNPRVGREEHWEETPSPTPEPKRILVVGGGPGGMEAAQVAAARGHRHPLGKSRATRGRSALEAPALDGMTCIACATISNCSFLGLPPKCRLAAMHPPRRSRHLKRTVSSSPRAPSRICQICRCPGRDD